ncbi:MAG TPA: carboxypeptidase regulatory-like domain-containing protein [Terriglobia bacterium]|nr:carboxypeptidase regulatory-like domain-containing protein [Terriglobia bacterium]
MRHRAKRGSPLWTCLLLVAFTVFLAPSLSFGQMVNASLTGTVTDPSGAAIPEASVTATDVATGQSTKTTSDPTGNYNLPSLPPATYTLTVEKAGFKTSVQTGITLLVDQRVTLNAQLQVGELATRVEVSGAAPMVETNSASVGTVIGERDVVDLPLNLRRFGALASLVPGTTTDNGGFANNQFGSPFSEESYTANGARSSSNNSIIDGVDSRNMTFGGFSVSPPPDAVQEFKVQTNIYDAAFGKTAGSTINLITKGGTNDWHGNLYEFLRNDYLDSAPHFQQTLPEYRRNQFGGSFGGPIKKNKAFFFVNYEELRQIQGGNSTTLVPTAAQLQGDFSHNYDGSSSLTGKTSTDGCGGTFDTGQLFDPSTARPCPTNHNIVIANAIPGNILFPSGGSRTLDPVAAHALSFNPFPAPNLTGVSGANFIQAAPLPLTQRQGDIRIDYNIGPRDQFMARYIIGNSYAVNPYSGYNILPGFGDTIYFRGQNLALGWTHTFGGHLLNEAHFGFQRDYDIADCASCPRAAGFQEGFGITNFHSVSPSFQGFPIFSFNNFSGIGDSNYRPVISPDMVEKYQDTLTWTHGRHTVVGGADFQFFQILREAASFAPHGQFYFNGQYSSLFNSAPAAYSNNADLADFLLGYPDNAATTLKYTNTNQVGGGFWNLYGQDNIKVSSNLTLNVGVRWEYRRWATDKRDNYLTLQPTAPAFSGLGDALLVSALPATQNDALCTDPADSYLHRDGMMSEPCLIATAAQRSSFGFTGRTARTLIHPQDTQFAPRLGISWRPTGSDKMVIRTGYGIFYDTPNMNNQHFVNNNPVFSPSSYFFTSREALPTATTANVFAGGSGIPPVSQQFVSLYVSPNYRAPYTQQWSFGIASQLSTNWAVDLAYIGAKGTHLGDLHLPANQPEPGPGDYGPRRPYPDFGTMLYTDPSANSRYESLQFKVTRRFSSGLSFLTSYTYSKSLDDNEGDEGFGGGRGNSDAQDDNRPWLDWGRSFTDARQRLVFSYIYELPVGKGRHFLNTGGAANAVLGGWQLSGVTSFQSGFPFTVTSADYSNTGSATPRPQRTCSGEGAKTLSAWFATNCFTSAPLQADNAANPPLFLFGNSGRNILSGPGLNDFDFLAMKRFKLGERFTFEFRAEMYNLFNTPNYAYPHTNVDSNAFGVISSTNGPARDIQFGLKLSF